MNKPYQAPNGSIRLFDLIRADNDKAKVAFYYALRDTLFCKDGNLANKIAYDPSCRRRVVSYAENRSIRVIEMNGTMSSCRARSGLFNKGKPRKSELDEGDILRLEADKEKLLSGMKQLQEEKKAGGSKLSELENDISEMERQKKINELKLQELNDELAYSMNRDPAKVAK